MEFHTAQPISGVDIAGEIVSYVVQKARQAHDERLAVLAY
jgi:hypothetical protein